MCPNYWIRWVCLLSFLLAVACNRLGGDTALPAQKSHLFPTAGQPSPTWTLTPFQPQPPTRTFTPAPTATVTATPLPIATENPLPQITLLFTGVIVPARCVQAAIDARGDPDYIYDEVRSLIQSANLAVGVFNATMSNAASRTGCVPTYVLVGDPQNADAMQRAGFDLMSVATNHIKNCGRPDCGDQAFWDTLENLQLVGILPVGAGATLPEALQPVVVTLQGVRFGFISLGEVETLAFAGLETPGIAVLTDDNLRQAIFAARQAADVVIAMPHWGPEDTPDPNDFQQRFAQAAVEAGADLVVGNHTHVVQAIQQINGVDVFYGLGNFVFDQTWDLAHQQGVILQVRFEGRRYLGYELIPTHVDGDGTVHLASPEESDQILARIQQASDRLK